MKIATQNLMLVAPIFVVLAIITSLLLFVSERREVKWGLDSEAQGVALVIAEFTDPATLAAVADGGAGAGEAAAMRVQVDRILKFGRAKRVALFALVDGRLRSVLDIGERAGTPSSIDAGTLRQIADGRTVTGAAPGASDRLAAYSPIHDGAGRVMGVVAIETSVAALTAHRDTILVSAALASLVLLVLGCLVSLVISRIISGEIGRLTRTAGAFLAGNYDAHLEPGPIAEVAVVGATFGIMGSVLKDATLRSTREMLQLERFHTESALAESFTERFAAPVAEERGGVGVAIDRIGSSMHGDAWFLCSVGDAHYGCLASVGRLPSFQSMVAASATAMLIEEALTGGATPAASLARAAELSPMQCGVLVRWAPGKRGAVEVWRLGPEGRVGQVVIDLVPGRTRVFTTLDRESDRRATRFADTYQFPAPGRCIDELQRFMGNEVSGGVLVLQTAASESRP